MTEAAAQLQKGLDQLALLPDDPKRQRRELELRSALGAVFMAVKASPLRIRGTPMPGHESCGSGWALPRSTFTFPMGSLVITWSAANSIWRCARPRICCV